MNFLRRLFGGKQRRPESAFDPGILQRFEREIETWPRHQAQVALLIIKGVLEDTPAAIDELYGDLTVSQLRKTTNVLREMHGEPPEPPGELG